jgi:hypothetical protein
VGTVDSFRDRRRLGFTARLAVLLMGAVLAAAPAWSAPSAAPASPATTAAGETLHIPGSMTLDYEVKARAFGLPITTTAQFIWQRQDGRYHGQWNVKVPILGERRQRSEGRVTPEGLAPEVYTEQVKSEKTAHFDYATRKIRFSDGTPDGALEPGTQDRLTVSLQLGALLQAAPNRYPPGSVIIVQTAGVRHVDPWHWRVVGDEALTVAGQQIPCVQLQRMPQEADDSHIDLWLGRQLDYLPVRLRVAQPDGDVVDQQLSALPQKP